jgi:hypothetical protein
MLSKSCAEDRISYPNNCSYDYSHGVLFRCTQREHVSTGPLPNSASPGGHNGQCDGSVDEGTSSVNAYRQHSLGGILCTMLTDGVPALSSKRALMFD